MDLIPINWALLKNPVNWFIVILMLLIAAFVLHIILPQSDATNN